MASNKNATILELGMAKLAHEMLRKGKTDFIDYIIPKKTSVKTENENINVNCIKEIPDDPVEAANKYKEAMK